jgi:phosphoglycerate dehydrogenase-like enzyme
MTTCLEMKPLVLLTTSAFATDLLFSARSRSELEAGFDVAVVAGEDPRFDDLLPRAFAVVGQPELPVERIRRAEQLRVVCNVEGNFFPNVDYAACFDRGIRVLSCGPAYAQPVAEFALGLALDLARGITQGDRDFRAGCERYTHDGTSGSVLLRHADIGLIGMGHLGRALLPLLRPFAPKLRVYDPWLPARALAELDLEPVGLDELLTASTFVFVLAASTTENTHLLDARRLALIPSGGRLILVSRAAAVDFAALYDRVAGGHLLAAVDVWPDEPVPADDQARGLEGIVLSAHRAGGIPSAFPQIGEMVVDDLRQVAAGLPPVRMQLAVPELVTRYRNKPVDR